VEDRQRLQIVDTFGMQARAANTYLIELLRTMAGKILRLLAETDPDLHLALLPQLNLLALFGQPDEPITPALKVPQRAQRLQTVGHQVLRLDRLLNDHLNQPGSLDPQAQIPLAAGLPQQDHRR
jgi:hypothetical protein